MFEKYSLASLGVLVPKPGLNQYRNNCIGVVLHIDAFIRTFVVFDLPSLAALPLHPRLILGQCEEAALLLAASAL